MKILIKIFFSLIIVFSAIKPGLAQNTRAEKKAAKAAEIKALVNSKDYVFKAEFMQPQAGGQRYISGNYYDLQIKPDTVVSFLPYFGVAHFGVAYGSPAEQGIQFTSTKFDYSDAENKNGMFLVTIKPKDAKYINRMYLNISPTGAANLSVISVNRESIRFSGQIVAKEKPKS